MNLKGQHIGRLFIFLAGLIILGHAVVPHHHHFELTYPSDQKSTCEIPPQNNFPEEHDFHCHAFNVLVSERTAYSSFNKPLPENFNFYLAGININIEIPKAHKATTIIYGYRAIFFHQFRSTAHSLRAPPVNA